MAKLWFILMFIGVYTANGQRQLQAVRTTSKFVIDGELTEAAWRQGAVADKFVEWRPAAGKAENAGSNTEVFLLYDNEAIYIGGFCHEVSTDSISKELVGRDKVGVNDFVGVIFDTYQDKMNGFGYYVTPLGEQYDAKYSSNGEDGSWSSVWASAAKIVEGGWTFEMKIPYSAIRFSNKNVQDWGLNITRRRSKTGQQYMWNPISPTLSGFLNQFGTWQNLQDIKPPLRLSLSPYFSTYVNHYPASNAETKEWSGNINGGMDVKLGLSRAFTLDMTLIPDFGQVQSDNQVLNLSPFEVRFNENRAFFTEGTELFNKGNFFYSRRIGGQPLHYHNIRSKLTPDEKIIKNPSVTKLINATKISGRTASGLGVGIFNAVANSAYAVVEDQHKNQREVQTNPLTNYNILVLDQSLKNNSSVSFINTNVLRNGHDYDANITSVLWDIYDKKVDWNLRGKLATSQLTGYLPSGKSHGGYLHNIAVRKASGRFNLQFSQDLTDKNYQQNDLGYFTNNNFLDHYAWIGYKWVKPKGWYNNLYYNFSLSYSERYIPRAYQSFTVSTNINGQLKNLWGFGIITDIKPERHDFYEPRVAGKMFRHPSSWMKGFWLNSNSARKYAFNVEVYNRTAGKYNYIATDIYINNRYRFSDRIAMSHTINLQPRSNALGFAFRPVNSDSSIIGLRNVHTVENVLNVKYSFSNRMSLSLRTRHYASKVNNFKLFNLKQDGYLEELGYHSTKANYNANFFNVDMVYTWEFAPGSFINIVWKDAIEHLSADVGTRYFQDLSNTIEQPQANSLSLKVIYFLDYLDIKKKRR